VAHIIELFNTGANDRDAKECIPARSRWRIKHKLVDTGFSDA
jgi:hypothetical protein